VHSSNIELLERHAPIARFNEGEYFLPASVEAFVRLAELWERTGPGSRERLAAAGTLDLERLVDLTEGHLARHYLRLVASPLPPSELVAWRLRQDRPRFRAETRLGRVGVFARLIDAGAKISLLLRGRVPSGAEAAAAILDRDRADHGDHPYYGRVLRSAGYLVLQYWFFSFFNDWRSRAHGVNDHEGDWEQVTIFLVEREDGPPTPEWVAFSAHDEVGANLRRRWDDPDLTVIDGHPVVHPGLGSHAGAYLPGEYLISIRGSRLAAAAETGRRILRFLSPWALHTREGIGIPYVEYARGDGVAIGAGQKRKWRPVEIDDDTSWVREYTGLWGDDTRDPFGGERGPAGPRYERNGTVRTSWGDPVRWAGLDAVVPGTANRRALIVQRIAELDDEIDQVRDEQERLRRRLRAEVIGGATDVAQQERALGEVSRLGIERASERHRLVTALRQDVPVEHPHAHLRHRNVPLPAEPRERRRLLRIWSTISTPVVFVLLALLLVLPTERPTIVLAGLGILLVLAIEAITRKRLLTFALSLTVLVVASGAAVVVITALLASWQLTLGILFLLLAMVFLVLNLREARRT
jgi:hypothetical protein